jgi:sec-independent protein translocase protein TatA
MDIGPAELIIVLIVVLVLFGGAKLPKLARSLGQAQTELRKGRLEGFRLDDEDEAKEAKAKEAKTDEAKAEEVENEPSTPKSPPNSDETPTPDADQ